MSKINYKKIQKINLSVTKKLLQYISKEMEKQSVMEELESLHKDFFTHNIAFDLWLSFDFLDKNGNSFIESFIQKHQDKLSSDEIKILEARNKSNISLFEVIDVKDDFILVRDLLENTEKYVWEPDLGQVVNVEDLVFTRTANLLGLETFVGSISYLPISVRDGFLREVFLDFNSLREISPSLSIKTYLKNHSINLYTIYTNCVFEAIELEQDISSIFYDELEEFDSYLRVKSKNKDINKISSNLIEFFEYYLADEDMSISDIDKIDFNFFFKSAIQDGFIMSSEILNSYINTFKLYLGFLSNMDSRYKESYNQILTISKMRFQLMNLLKQVKVPFEVNEKFCKVIKKNLDDFCSVPIVDFDKFILYMLNNPIELTVKTQKIKRHHLLEINNILDLSEIVKKKAPNQIDFPLINLYYNLTLFLGLGVIKGNKLHITSKGSNFLRLRDEEKFTIFFEYIWSKDFIDTVYTIESEKTFGKYKKDLLTFLSSLDENKKYEMLEVFPKTSIDSDFFFNYYEYLKYLGIIDYSLYPNYEISITQLGKAVVNYLLSKDKPSSIAQIIELSSIRKEV